MGKFSYSPEINEKINQLCHDFAIKIMLDFPDYLIDDIESVINKITSFIKNNFEHLGSREYLIVIDFEDTSDTVPLTPEIVMNEIIEGNNVFKINKNLNVQAVDKILHLSVPGIAAFSRDNKSVVIFVHNGIDITIYSKGFPFEQRNLNYPSALATVNNKYNRPAEDYKVSLIEFYKEKVRTNVTQHWYDPKKRILKGGQTEEIFLMALVNWFNDNLTCKKINFKVNKISKDETDIEIIKHGGDTYLLELKWMGKNQHSDYTIAKIISAFDQVQNYLEAEPDVLEATLVVFDGRKVDEYKALVFNREETGNWKETNQCGTKTLPFRGIAYMFYLINETASTRKIA